MVDSGPNFILLETLENEMIKFKNTVSIGIIALALCGVQYTQAEGWKSGLISQTGTSATDYGGCFAYFDPDDYTEQVAGMSECNGISGGIYYVSLDCDIVSAPTTAITKSAANANFAQTQLAAVASKTIGLYITDAQIDGFCVATKTSVAY
jgi:hypothetical protein